MPNRNLYTWTGLALLVAGGLTFLAAYFIFRLPWLTALGMAMGILGFLCLALSRTISRVSPEVSALLLETGMDNLASMIEELGIQSRGIYLPSSLTQGRPQALIPLYTDHSVPRVTARLPQRLIVRYGREPDNMGLLVTTLGTTALGMLETVPGNTAAEMETALTRLFSGTLGVADGARVVYHDNRIEVEISNPRLSGKPSRSQKCLGGPLASVVAAVAAEACNQPIAITQEGLRHGKSYIELEVLRESI